DVIDMAVREPDLLDRDAGLPDRLLDPRHVPAGIDHDGLFGGLAPDDGAVLFERRHWHDDGAGFRPGLGVLCHGPRMPIFGGPPRETLAIKAPAESARIPTWSSLPARSASCPRRTAASPKRRWRSRAAPRGCSARSALRRSANCRCPRAAVP